MKTYKLVTIVIFMTFSTLLFSQEAEINGYIYYGDSETTLDNVSVQLFDCNNVVVASTVSNLVGYYEFPNLSPGEYQLVCSTNAEWNECTVLDANLVYEYLLNISPLDELQMQAADVNNNDTLEFDDAQMIVDRYLDSISAFPAGDWVFDEAFVQLSDTIRRKDINGRSTGDTFGGYIPPSAKGKPGIYVISEFTINTNIDSEVLIPIKLNRNVNLSTLSLVINIPENVIVMDVVSVLSDLQFAIKNDKVRIGWAGKGSQYNVAANEEFLYLKVKSNSRYQSSKPMSFSLNKISEFSDANGEKLYGVSMFIPKVKSELFEIELMHNYPNPFVNKTTVRYRISKTANVSISVFNACGQIVYETKNYGLEAGEHNFVFDGSKLKPGLFFYRIEAVSNNENITKTKRIMLIK